MPGKYAILSHIIIGKQAKIPLLCVESVKAIAGRGLQGDRYFFGQGSFNRAPLDQNCREVTLISYEAIATCESRTGTSLPPEAFRRNLVIKDFDLLSLKGKRFRIGDVLLEYARTAPPCRLLSRLTDVDMMTGLKGLGGIRATILESGTLQVGETLTLVDP